MKRLLVTPLIIWLVHVALWLAFTTNTGPRELIAAAITSAISTTAVLVYARTAKLHITLRPRDLFQMLRIPWYILTGNKDLLLALIRQCFTTGGADSFLAAVPFDVGDDSPASVGRRALAVTGSAITPNFVVIGIVPEQRLLLFHQVLRSPVRPMTQNLGARP